MKVEDVMSKDLIVSYVPGTIRDALKILAKHNVSGMPVLKKDTKKVVGVVTRNDIFKKSDEEQLAFAARQGRIFLTCDNDFLRLHAQGIQHAGIVYVNRQTPIGILIRGIMLIYEVLDDSEMQNHVEYLS